MADNDLERSDELTVRDALLMPFIWMACGVWIFGAPFVAPLAAAAGAVQRWAGFQGRWRT
ncbi:MAG TPA: hypothetical protein VFX49_00565 [Chloroflexota bacterium]|nr:hypothetical protein [Chloroflexota bacterium]